MGLMDDIEQEIKKSKMPKWKILEVEVGEEVKKMIENMIPIDKQIELILKHKILEKLDRKEYTNIIKKHFGYIGRNQKKYVTKNTPVAVNKKVAAKEENREKSIEEKLSKDVDLMSLHLKKKSESLS